MQYSIHHQRTIFVCIKIFHKPKLKPKTKWWLYGTLLFPKVQSMVLLRLNWMPFQCWSFFAFRFFLFELLKSLLPTGSNFEMPAWAEKWEYSEMQNLFSDYSDAKARSQKLAPRVFQPEKHDICKEPSSLILQLPNCGSVGQWVPLAFKSIHTAE